MQIILTNDRDHIDRNNSSSFQNYLCTQIKKLRAFEDFCDHIFDVQYFYSNIQHVYYPGGFFSEPLLYCQKFMCKP